MELTNNEIPVCPDCGGPMHLKHRSRDNKPFWSCKKWKPNSKGCKGTRDVTEENVENYSGELNLGIRSRPIIAGASSKQRKLAFYEAAMVPRNVVAHFAISLTPEYRRSVSGWTAEWPQSVPNLNPSITPSWLVVVAKLLRRGSIIPLEQKVVENLELLLGTPSENIDDWAAAVTRISERVPSPIAQHDTFDSEAERKFFDQILHRLTPEGCMGFWKRQVAIGSLTGKKSDFDQNQRVDFFFSHPTGIMCVVEVDGEQHKQEIDSDLRRDKLLGDYGIPVIRIPTSELAAGDGSGIRKLVAELSSIPRPAQEPTLYERWIFAGKRVHQLQLVIIEALERGILNALSSGIIRVAFQPDFIVGNNSLTSAVLAEAVHDLNRIIQDVCGCCGHPSGPTIELVDKSEASLLISFDGITPQNQTLVLIQDSYITVTPEIDSPRTRPWITTEVDRLCCTRILKRVYGYSEFREGQFEAIERSLKGLDALVLLPTGSGKSIAFQLASFLRAGVGIIVDPIVSLMEDQLENLRSHGIDRVESISGKQSTEEREQILALFGLTQYWLYYVSPERFQSVSFRDSLRTLTTNTPVSLVVIDEVHGVSEWGHDFRPAYLNLARIARDYCAFANQVPPLMGLTGTASRSVLKDVQRELGITDFDAVIVPKSFDRKELNFEAIACRTTEKTSRLKGLLEKIPSIFGEQKNTFYSVKGAHTKSGLVFCPWVGADQGIVTVAETLTDQLHISVPFYGAKPPKGLRKDVWDKELKQTAEGFKRNRFPVMTCTKAFGMGIDKPNVRYTIHYNIPTSIEAFYQEAGRAGRDGSPAHCFILYSDDNPERTGKLLSPTTSDMNDLRNAVELAGWDNSDDITRALFFHNSSFQGAAEDKKVLESVVEMIAPIDLAGPVKLPFNKTFKRDDGSIIDDKKIKEQALHRLVVTGVISDYTINYSRSEFDILKSGSSKQTILDQLYRYVSAYQRQRAVKAIADARRFIAENHDKFVLAVSGHLIDFVYEVIERGRRQALSEILRVCKKSVDPESLRLEMLKYLERSKFADQIDGLLESDNAGLGNIETIVVEVRSFLDAAELRGECARELESYPDQPSLRLLRAVSEAMSQNPDKDIISENVAAGLLDGMGKYGLPLEKLLDVVAAIAETLSDSRDHLGRLIIQSAVYAAPDSRMAARYLISIIRPSLMEPAIAVLVDSVVKSVQQLNRS